MLRYFETGLENRDYGRKGSVALTTRYPSIRKTLALTLPTSCGRLAGIVLSRTEAKEFIFVLRHFENHVTVFLTSLSQHIPCGPHCADYWNKVTHENCVFYST
jgi:hypothetical protein